MKAYVIPFGSMKEAIVGITELRDRAREIIALVDETDIVVLRRNRPVARIVHPDRIAQLLARVEQLEAAVRDDDINVTT